MLVGGIYLATQLTHSLAQVRESIARLARRDFRPVILMHPMGLFSKTAENLRIISEHLQAQNRQLADEGFSLRAILGSMVEGVMIVDPDQRIRMVNEELTRMFQMTQPVINRSVAEVFLNPDLQRAVRETFQDGMGRRIQMEFRSTGFSERKPSTLHLEVNVSPLNPGEKRVPRGAVIVFHNITQLKLLEAARQEFVANVSHEFRTPLAIISGYTETLQEMAGNDEKMRNHSLEVIQKHCERLNFLIEDLLTISGMDAKTSPLEFAPVDLRQILEYVLDQVKKAHRESKAEIRVEIKKGAVVFEADAWRLEQVFYNLINNGIRYAVRPGVRTKIRIAARIEGDSVLVVLSDNGPGIPEKDLPRIFERFYRVHKDRSRNAGGTGLGLSIVKNIVAAHGGSITAAGSPEGGAEFLLKFPVSQTPAAAIEKPGPEQQTLPFAVSDPVEVSLPVTSRD